MSNTEIENFCDFGDDRVQNYEASNRLNQSKLKASYYGRKNKTYEDMYFLPKRHFVVGDVVDLMCTGDDDPNSIIDRCCIVPNNTKDDYIRFAMSVIISPLDTVDYTKKLEDLTPVEEDKIYELGEYYKLYANNWKKPTKIKKYYSLLQKLVKPVNKMCALGNDFLYFITENEYLELTHYNRLRQHKWTKKALNGKGTIIKQAALYFTFEFLDNKVDCKALLDYLIIDEKKKEIYIYDLKTTAKPLNQFNKAAKEYGYDIQLAWYYYAVSKVFPDYKIMGCGFIVFSAIDNYPTICMLSKEDIKEATWGSKRIDSAAKFLDGINEDNSYVINNIFKNIQKIGFSQMIMEGIKHNFDCKNIPYYILNNNGVIKLKVNE